MNISESKLRKIVLEEVQLRLLDNIIEEEMLSFLFEQIDVDEEDVEKEWKESQSFRNRIKDAIQKFDKLPSLKRKILIAVIGALGAVGTDLVTQYASDVQADDIRSELSAQAEETKEKYFGSVEDLSNFRQAATAEGAPPIDVNDEEAIEAAKDKFMAMGVQAAPVVPDTVIAMQTGETEFGYTPASAIPDDEILPFVGMSKADWESILRTWLTSPEGLERLEKYVGTSGKTQAMFWAYGPRGQLFSDAYDENPDGRQGLWLPPEWSVAYDVIQKRKAREGALKEILKKYLHSFGEVL